MKKIIFIVIISLFLINDDAFARGSFSSSGGRGGFSSGRSYSSPSRSYASSPGRSTTVTRTTTTRSYYGGYGGSYYHPYYGHPMMYGGFGMGYGYSNGLMEGLIIGSLMHPAGTVMYSGPGAYANNALLYPNGTVVDQNGYQVGMYQNGQFTAQQGGMMAQQAPQQPVQQQPAQPVIIHSDYVGWEIAGIIIVFILIIFIFCAIFI